MSENTVKVSVYPPTIASREWRQLRAAIDSAYHDRDATIILNTADVPVAVITPIPQHLWLADDSVRPLGIFSSPEAAKLPCQMIANEYFGAQRTPALQWQGDDECGWQAVYQHPLGFITVFSVTPMTVNEVRQ
jgi:hypothetical protein